MPHANAWVFCQMYQGSGWKSATNVWARIAPGSLPNSRKRARRAIPPVALGMELSLSARLEHMRVDAASSRSLCNACGGEISQSKRESTRHFGLNVSRPAEDDAAFPDGLPLVRIPFNEAAHGKSGL